MNLIWQVQRAKLLMLWLRNILENFDLKVSGLYIAQIKKKCGIELRENYYKSKKEKQVIPQCTPEKGEVIKDALRNFKMI